MRILQQSYLDKLEGGAVEILLHRRSQAEATGKEPRVRRGKNSRSRRSTALYYIPASSLAAALRADRLKSPGIVIINFEGSVRFTYAQESMCHELEYMEHIGSLEDMTWALCLECRIKNNNPGVISRLLALVAFFFRSQDVDILHDYPEFTLPVAQAGRLQLQRFIDLLIDAWTTCTSFRGHATRPIMPSLEIAAHMSAPADDPSAVFYLSVDGLQHAVLVIKRNAYIVKAGSAISEYIYDERGQRARENYDGLVKNGRTSIDIVFSSPTTAATYVLGRNKNGHIAWRDARGHTIREAAAYKDPEAQRWIKEGSWGLEAHRAMDKRRPTGSKKPKQERKKGSFLNEYRVRMH